MKMEIVFESGKKETFKSIESFKLVGSPIENVKFEVNPLDLDRSLFEQPVEWYAESTRKLIQQAFAEVDKNPEKYATRFYTFIPSKANNASITVKNAVRLASFFDGEIADWVYQALEWAQRICNGESWKKLCENYDSVKWRRLILWKDNSYRCVGGERHAPSSVDKCEDYVMNWRECTRFYHIVPLIVFKEK